jgi:hypothetical protein
LDYSSRRFIKAFLTLPVTGGPINIFRVSYHENENDEYKMYADRKPSCTCISECPEMVQLVCASNGRAYRNQCTMKQVIILMKVIIVIIVKKIIISLSLASA